MIARPGARDHPRGVGGGYLLFWEEVGCHAKAGYEEEFFDAYEVGEIEAFHVGGLLRAGQERADDLGRVCTVGVGDQREQPVRG